MLAFHNNFNNWSIYNVLGNKTTILFNDHLFIYLFCAHF